jgi:hypothetical protein
MPIAGCVNASGIKGFAPKVSTLMDSLKFTVLEKLRN